MCNQRCLWKGHFSCGYRFPLASLAKQTLQAVWTWILFPLQCLVRQQPALVGPALKVEANEDDRWWRGPQTPAPDCRCHCSWPKRCRLFTECCWCQFTLRGNRTKAHAGSSHFRMRIINLTPCIERSQCQGRAINSTSCSGALEGKGEGDLGSWRLFFLPQTCGNRFYIRLLHKERVRGKNILV